MNGIHMNLQRFALSLTAAVCMAGLPALAQTGAANEQPGTTNEQTGTMNQQPGAVNQQPGTMNPQQPGEFSSQSGSQWNNSGREHMRSQSVFSSSTVRRVQRELKADGFYHGKVDGISGPKTHAAIRAYQHDNRLAATGRLDTATMRRLGVHRAARAEASRRAACNSTASRSMLRRHRASINESNGANRLNNSQNYAPNANINGAANRSSEQSGTAAAAVSRSTIQAAQRKLKADGVYSGAINGRMDAATQTAIRDYQQKNNLTANGQLDQPTLSSLGVAATTNNRTTGQSPSEQPQK
jgi:peptidoglycan hydrolase-like protein with peptidoglycan-binding domain